MRKQTFFVSPNGDLHDEKIDLEPHYFKIQASADEIKTLELIIRKAKKFQKDEALNLISSNIYRERKVDQDRGESNQAIHDLYAKIYELGTDETKKEIDSLGILSAS